MEEMLMRCEETLKAMMAKYGVSTIQELFRSPAFARDLLPPPLQGAPVKPGDPVQGAR